MKSLKIKNIRKIGLRKTFDLQVADNNNFLLGNKILSHNSGKSCKLLTVCQSYHSKGYKIFDIYGGKRDEGSFWALPNKDEKLWKIFEQETHEFVTAGQKQYKVNLLYPMFLTKLPKKLPSSPPNVKSRLFTIPILDIIEKDISLVIGPLGSRAKTLWSNILRNLNENSNLSDLEYLMNSKFKNRKNEAIYQLFILPMLENFILSSKNFDLVIDLETEAKDVETVSVLCLDYVPEQFHFLIMGYFVRKLGELAQKNKITKKNIMLFREASYFMKVQDSDLSRSEVTSIFRNIIVDSARYARWGVFFAGDSQDSSEVHGMIEGSEDVLLICEMPSPSSREVTCMPLKRDKRMNEAQIRYISVLPIHQVCIVTRGERAKILKRIQPPRTRYWKVEDGNFFTVWRNEVNLWTNVEPLIKLCVEDYNRRKELNDIKLINEEREENDEEEPEEIIVKKTMEVSENGSRESREFGREEEFGESDRESDRDSNRESDFTSGSDVSTADFG